MGSDGIIPKMLESLPEILIGIVVILVLSVINVNAVLACAYASSSTLTLDLINPLCKNKLDEKKSLIVMRAFIAIFLIRNIGNNRPQQERSYLQTLWAIRRGCACRCVLSTVYVRTFLEGCYQDKRLRQLRRRRHRHRTAYDNQACRYYTRLQRCHLP